MFALYKYKYEHKVIEIFNQIFYLKNSIWCPF